MALNAQMAKAGPPFEGKDLHIGDFSWGILPPAAPLGISTLTIAGMAMAFARERSGRVALSFIGVVILGFDPQIGDRWESVALVVASAFFGALGLIIVKRLQGFTPAELLGLPTLNQQDLVEALFHDGLSTRGQVTEYSGRGIGMGAVRRGGGQKARREQKLTSGDVRHRRHASRWRPGKTCQARPPTRPTSTDTA